MWVLENTTGLRVNAWKENRIYINAELGKLARTIYFDLASEALYFKGSNARVDKRAWEVEKIAPGQYKIISASTLDKKYILVECKQKNAREGIKHESP